MTTTVVEITRNVVITDVSGTPAVIVSPQSGIPTVVVSAGGSQGPPGSGIRVLGTLPAGATPNQFPTTPAPIAGDAWSIHGEQLWVWNGASWVLVFEIPSVETYVSLQDDQTIDGRKTFIQAPRSEDPPLINADLTNKFYVDSLVVPELSYIEHQHAVGLWVLAPEESDELVPVGGIIIRRTQ